jgi:hypothetical protein
MAQTCLFRVCPELGWGRWGCTKGAVSRASWERLGKARQRAKTFSRTLDKEEDLR